MESPNTGGSFTSQTTTGCPFIHHPAAPSTGEQIVPRVGNDSLNSNPLGPSTVGLLGFETTNRAFIGGTMTAGTCNQEDEGGNPPTWEKANAAAPEPTHYSSYLGVEKLLQLQHGPAGAKPQKTGLLHHEELTFIVVHQVFELWFKLMIADLSKARGFLMFLERENKASGHNRLTECLSYLRRAEFIFHHVQGAFGVLETMHPGDFIEFRDFLIPASGFQSVGFRQLEQMLGVQNAGRQKVNGSSVFDYLKSGERDLLALEAEIPSLNDVILHIGSRLNVPEGFIESYLATHRTILEEQQYVIAGSVKGDTKAERHISRGMSDLEEMLNDPGKWSEGVFFADDDAEERYKKAVVGCLLAIAYRHDPRFSLFAQVLDQMIAVEEGLMLWRSRHSHMAERMIGRRLGTGGSSGVGYLDVTRRYRVFHCLWLVRKILTRSSALPPLSTYPGFEELPFFVDGDKNLRESPVKRGTSPIPPAANSSFVPNPSSVPTSSNASFVRGATNPAASQHQRPPQPNRPTFDISTPAASNANLLSEVEQLRADVKQLQGEKAQLQATNAESDRANSSTLRVVGGIVLGVAVGVCVALRNK